MQQKTDAAKHGAGGGGEHGFLSVKEERGRWGGGVVLGETECDTTQRSYDLVRLKGCEVRRLSRPDSG